MDQINDLINQVQELQDRVKELESNKISFSMPNDTREALRESVIDDRVIDTSTYARTQSVTIGAGGGTVSFSVPKNFAGYLKVPFKGVTYIIPYY